MSTVVFAWGGAWVRSALPVSRAMVRASSSTRASSASAIRARSRPRSRGTVRDQAGKASAPAFTARATSSERPRGTSAIERRCAGSSTSSTSPEALSTQFPPINMRADLSAASSARSFLIAVMLTSIALFYSPLRSAALRPHLLDHLVGAEQRGWHFEAERLGGHAAWAYPILHSRRELQKPVRSVY